MSETTLEPQESKPSKKKIITITAASVAGVLVLAGAGLGLYRNHQVQTLTTECVTAVNTVKKTQKQLSDLAASDDVSKALKVSEKQVADKKVISDLKTAVEDASTKISIPDCAIQFFNLNTNPGKDVHIISKTVTNKISAITDTVEAVNKSVAAKQFQDTKDKLKQTIDNASKVLADSDGKVQDNATRDNLSKAIELAKKILDDKKNTDVKKLDTKALDDAVNGVNASIEAKRQADEEAARQAQAQATQNTWTPTYMGGSSGYIGGGYSAPQQSAPAPSNNGGGNGKTFEELLAEADAAAGTPTGVCSDPSKYCPLG